ncbi:GntR family transcriptional regulator [Rhodococcus erythropolis]|uniref:GntR family transcriptional regulator n=1 Tax=Rhodococcus erythropolis TaxID=1833 RepID=UPI000697AD9F|nr:GntR family transcriptional regulator [Rhodococcus erythropolis]
MNRQSRLPKYLAIYDDLRTRVEAGQWQADEQLPPQRELAISYGVTLMTLRQALQLLEQDGLIQTKPGLGTFPVGHRYTYNLLHLSGFAEDLESQGAKVDTRILEVSKVILPPHIAHALRLEPTDLAHLIVRHRVIDTRPAVLQYSYLPLWLSVDPDELLDTSLYQFLAQRGFPVASAEERLVITTLHGREAELLARSSGSAAMLSQRTSLDEGGSRVLHDSALIPADIAELHIDRGPQSLQVQYRITEGKSLL